MTKINFKNYTAEEAQPSPKSTINSYRSFGYNLSTAIADILDNSISAKARNVRITYCWKGQESYICILDDGEGMKLEELVQAMKPGSKDPSEIRNHNDLGRFGMGLKTASFSQAKRLTVVSKKNSTTNKRCWDIDYINEQESWTLLDFISDENHLKKLEEYKSGTMVLWEVLDRIVGSAKENNEQVKKAFYEEMSRVNKHLSLVFHRFLENDKLSIFSNERELAPWNPFLYNLSVKPEMGPAENLENNVTCRYYILPHMSRISKEEYNTSGGPLGWFSQQGFYIYRSDRLLVAGDWLGLEKKKDYSKLARISIDFPNTSDFEWNLDIKKSTATPPIGIRTHLRQIAKLAIKESAKIYNWRGVKTSNNTIASSNNIPLWTDSLSRDGSKSYNINKEHPFIKLLLESDNKKKLFSSALKLIEENIPTQLILFNHNDDPAYHELVESSEIPEDSLVQLAKDIYKAKVELGLPKELARQQLMNSIPFNQFPLINEYLK
jgi:hypothetical protein